MDLLLKLRPSGGLIVGEKLFHDLSFLKEFREGPMPLPALSDLLLTEKREFVGLYFCIHANHESSAAEFAALCDPRIVRYLSNFKAAQFRHYQNVVNSAVVELRWSAIEPALTEIAQLTDDWYYSTNRANNGEYPSIYGYRNVERILTSYKIVLPQTHY
jgi:hypothetical protein